MIKALKWVLRILFYLIVILAVLLLLFILSYNMYLQSNLTKVFDSIPGIENARIEFDKAVIDLWDNYPEAQITLHNGVAVGYFLDEEKGNITYFISHITCYILYITHTQNNEIVLVATYVSITLEGRPSRLWDQHTSTSTWGNVHTTDSLA